MSGVESSAYTRLIYTIQQTVIFAVVSICMQIAELGDKRRRNNVILALKLCPNVATVVACAQLCSHEFIKKALITKLPFVSRGSFCGKFLNKCSIHQRGYLSVPCRHYIYKISPA